MIMEYTDYRKEIGNYRITKKLVIAVLCIVLISFCLIKNDKRNLKHHKDNTAVNVFSFIT